MKIIVPAFYKGPDRSREKSPTVKFLVELDDTSYIVEFPQYIVGSKRKEALEKFFPKTAKVSQIKKVPNGKITDMRLIHFGGWRARYGIKIPYKYLLALGMLFIFFGSVIIVVSIGKIHE